ncbi:MAG: hypothetical protein J6U54_07630 [Clostridiales bacterium]|nr:hypothetical protein [Clostridiales bacterium]
MVGTTTLQIIVDMYKDLKNNQEEVLKRLERIEDFIKKNSISGLTVTVNDEVLCRKD